MVLPIVRNSVIDVTHKNDFASRAATANKIVVLKRGGTIVEEGTYDELVAIKGGRFNRMVEGGDEEE